MNIRDANITDIDNLSVLFNSYRMFYGKESNIDISTKEHHHKVKETEHGKKAISTFKVIKKFNSFTYAEILISTGRMHPIRVQS